MKKLFVSLCIFLLCGIVNAQDIMLEIEDFQYYGDWQPYTNFGSNSGNGAIIAGNGAPLNAVTAVEIPDDGTYQLWIYTLNFPYKQPGKCLFDVSIGGHRNSFSFGNTGIDKWSWQKGDLFELKKGTTLISIIDDNAPDHWGRADALILTRDLKYVPQGKLRKTTPIVRLPYSDVNRLDFAEVSGIRKDSPCCVLQNDRLKIEFVPAQKGGKATFVPMMQIKAGATWIPVEINSSSESYQVVKADYGTYCSFMGFYHSWLNDKKAPLEIQIGGAKESTKDKSISQVVWSAGQSQEYIVENVTELSPNRARLDFYSHSYGQLYAIWELKDGHAYANVEMHFIPASEGEYSLGYCFPDERPIDNVEEVLLPLMVSKKRFPSVNSTMFNTQMPTPVSVFHREVDGVKIVSGVAGDNKYLPYEYPGIKRTRFGLHIRNDRGNVHPSYFAPLFGLPGSKVGKGQQIDVAFNVLMQEGTCYDAYRTVADSVYQWRDYRSNDGVCLTDAIYNMIDLWKDDVYSGWWDRAKAYFQIESKNGASQSAPLVDLSLFRLTGDMEGYEKRVIPTMEYMLSRSTWHFSPIPENAGRYAHGSMKGPVRSFGMPIFGNMWKMTGGHTRAFYDIWQSDKPLERYRAIKDYDQHRQYFDWCLSQYQLTKKKMFLNEAEVQANDYINNYLHQPLTKEIGPGPFFLVDFLPSWEGLLKLYEITGKQKYLDAVVTSTHMLMTGIWTQPTPPEGDITIHKNGICEGDHYENVALYKGENKYRLGYPRKDGDTPEHQAPAWKVSSVGLGLEQPCTFPYIEAGGRFIFQAPWTPAFQRLAFYTGDKQYETYARNAVVGRWATYPGYYTTTFTDLFMDPKYNYEGPDMTSLYFHHMNVHMGWAIDYLISEAFSRSSGQFSFPALRQYGYAYFDYNVYGHEPGQIYGDESVWLWFDRQLASVSNKELNYIPAHSDDSFYLTLMNESSERQESDVEFNFSRISPDTATYPINAVDMVTGKVIPLKDNRLRLEIGAREIAVIKIEGLNIKVPVHEKWKATKSDAEVPYYVEAVGPIRTKFHAAALQVLPNEWQAFIWSDAGSRSLKSIRLDWYADGQEGYIVDTDYPYEFSIPVKGDSHVLEFKLTTTMLDGRTHQTKYMKIGN